MAGSEAIFFLPILFEGADAESWRDLEPYNFQPVFFFRSGAIIFLPILFEGAGAESWRDLEPYNFQPDSF